MLKKLPPPPTNGMYRVVPFFTVKKLITFDNYRAWFHIIYKVERFVEGIVADAKLEAKWCLLRTYASKEEANIYVNMCILAEKNEDCSTEAVIAKSASIATILNGIGSSGTYTNGLSAHKAPPNESYSTYKYVTSTKVITETK